MIPKLIVIAVSAIVTGIAISGFTHDRIFSPLALGPISTGINQDGWVEDGTSIEFPDLMPYGNRLILSWNPWRPAGVDPAALVVSVCGEERGRFAVTGREPIALSLSGSCEPRTVTFDVQNPFTPGGNDSRRLGVQLERAELATRLGPPLVSSILMLKTVAAVVLTALLVFWAAYPNKRAFAIGVFVPLGMLAFAALNTAEVEQLVPLWMLFVAGVAGVWAARFTGGAPDSRWAWPILAIIVALGATLRLYGLDFGLPKSNFHPDEVPKVNAIMRMVDSGTFDPVYFLHPSLLLYCTYGMNTLLHYFGIDGSFRDTAFLAGRIVSATAGILSLIVVYALGSRLYSRRAGLMASAILAVLPLHVTCSRYLKEDSLLTFFCLLTILTVAEAAYRNRPPLLLLSGLLAGVTASTKYSGLLIVVTLFAAPWLASKDWRPDRRFLVWAILGSAVAPIGFFACTPYALITWEKFSKDFESEQHHMQTGHTTAIDPWSQLWMYHFERSVLPGMTEFTTLLAIAGIGFLLVRRERRDLCIIAAVLLFYLPAEYVKAKPAPQPERYILPCLPFLALAAARLLDLLPKRAAWALGVAALAFPLVRTVQLATELKPDTRDQMASWMVEHLPHGSTVLMDWKPYGPRFDGAPFNVVYIPRAHIVTDLDIKKLKASGGHYLILSSLFYERYFSQPKTEPHLRQRFREVFERVPAVIQFSPANGTYGFHNPILTLFSLKPEEFERVERERAAKRAGQLTNTTNELRAQLKW